MKCRKKNEVVFGYIGSFPPPYGGVTVKNDIWFNEFRGKINIIKIEFTKNPILMIKFALKIMYCKGYIIGIASSKKCILFTKLLAKFFPQRLKNSIIFIMGGSFGKCIVKNDGLTKYFTKYSGIFVELESIKKELFSAGLKNVYCVPNCRKRPLEDFSTNKNDSRLQCVIFSLIFPEKGIDLVLEAAKRMPSVDFSFWGEIKKEYKLSFLEQVEQCENCLYCGVYKYEFGSVYEVLSRYDLLVFPTRWKTEGMPGALIESKIAGLPAVVSRHAYNMELVEHMYDGIVMETYDVGGLINAIKLLDEDRKMLAEMKKNVKSGTEKYFIDKYVNDVIEIIQGKRITK